MNLTPLRYALVVLVVSASLGFLAGVASADHTNDPADHIPESATCTYDSSVEKYNPSVVIGHLDVKPTSVYGSKYTSADRDTTIYTYWVRYTHQEGVSEADSHFGDHEPIYVVVDDESGNIDSVTYSAYHYLRGETLPNTVNETHVTMRATTPYHHYTPTTSAGQELSLKNGCTATVDWQKNGWDAAAEPVFNPWTISNEYRESWWPRNSFGFSVTETYYEIERELPDIPKIL